MNTGPWLFNPPEGYDCVEYQELDRVYTDAWTAGNHAKVMEGMKAIEEHKRTCPKCRPVSMVHQLWPGAVVSSDADPQGL